MFFVYFFSSEKPSNPISVPISEELPNNTIVKMEENVEQIVPAATIEEKEFENTIASSAVDDYEREQLEKLAMTGCVVDSLSNSPFLLFYDWKMCFNLSCLYSMSKYIESCINVKKLISFCEATFFFEMNEENLMILVTYSFFFFSIYDLFCLLFLSPVFCSRLSVLFLSISRGIDNSNYFILDVWMED